MSENTDTSIEGNSSDTSILNSSSPLVVFWRRFSRRGEKAMLCGYYKGYEILVHYIC